MFAAHKSLDNIIAFTDCNKLQLDGAVGDVCNIEPLDKKWEAFGWDVITVKNGNSCAEIDDAVSSAKTRSKPVMILLNTVKGWGISFAEKAGESNHSMPVTKEMFEEGMKELGGNI